MNFLINQPYLYLIIQIIVSIFSMKVYNLKYNINNYLVILIMIIILFFYASLIKVKKIKKKIELPNENIFAIIILISNFIEYKICGIPLLNKNVIYAKYGITLLHHISVTSWILSFSKKRIYKFFSLLNPILIQNRDLFLLTVFCFLMKRIYRKEIKKIYIIIISIGIFILFGVLGNLRSGTALVNTKLPYNPFFMKMNSIFQWGIVYATSSFFNFNFNLINNTQNILYVKNLNVFPGVSYFYNNLGFVGIFLYYNLILLILYFLRKKSKKNNFLLCIYIFFQYQSIMTLFSKKFFRTHSLFVFLITCIYIFMLNLKEKNNKRRKAIFKIAKK